MGTGVSKPTSMFLFFFNTPSEHLNININRYNYLDQHLC